MLCHYSWRWLSSTKYMRSWDNLVRSDLLQVLRLSGTFCRHLLFCPLSEYGTLIRNTTHANTLWLISRIIIHGWYALCKSIRYNRRGIFWRIFTISCFGQRNDSEVPRLAPLNVMGTQNWWFFCSHLSVWLDFKFEVVRNESFRQIIWYFSYFLYD